MEKIEDIREDLTGGPAFPCSVRTIIDEQMHIKVFAGMTLRHYFAAAALTGFWSAGDFSPLREPGETYDDAYARLAFKQADAMLKQSAQTEKGKS